jgi:hypothetical protein
MGSTGTTEVSTLLALTLAAARLTLSFPWRPTDHSGILPAFRWLADAEMTEDLLRHFYRASLLVPPPTSRRTDVGSTCALADDIEVHFYLVDKDVMAAVGKLEVSRLPSLRATRLR